MAHDQERGQIVPLGTELAKRRPGAEQSQDPPRTTGEPTVGDRHGQRQPAQAGERADEAGKTGYRPGQEPPRVIDGRPEMRAPR